MSYAEPSDVGPAFGGDRRVHDEDRAKVVTLLDTALSAIAPDFGLTR